MSPYQLYLGAHNSIEGKVDPQTHLVLKIVTIDIVLGLETPSPMGLVVQPKPKPTTNQSLHENLRGPHLEPQCHVSPHEPRPY